MHGSPQESPHSCLRGHDGRVLVAEQWSLNASPQQFVHLLQVGMGNRKLIPDRGPFREVGRIEAEPFRSMGKRQSAANDGIDRSQVVKQSIGGMIGDDQIICGP